MNSTSQSGIENKIKKNVSGDGDGEDDDDDTKDNHYDGLQVTAFTNKVQVVLYDVDIVSTNIVMHETINGTTKKHNLNNDAAIIHQT